MSNRTLYVLGECPSCETGPLGARICGQCGKPTLMCDECDATWSDLAFHRPAIYPPQPDLPCPGCGASLARAPAHWATFDELERIGWQANIIAVGRSFEADAAVNESNPSETDPSSTERS